MAQSIKQILEGPEVSGYLGSEKTKSMVEQEIVKRWGQSELKNYDPMRSVLSARKWISLGFIPKKGETAIRSFVAIERKDPKNPEKVTKKIKSIYLFYFRQVTELKNK